MCFFLFFSQACGTVAFAPGAKKRSFSQPNHRPEGFASMEDLPTIPFPMNGGKNRWVVHLRKVWNHPKLRTSSIHDEKSILWISAYLTEKHQIGFATSHPFRCLAPSGHVEADNQDTMSSHEVLHPGLWNFGTNGNLKTGLVVSSWNHDISREVHKSW